MPADQRQQLLTRLDRSRQVLLDALEGVTERDFATRLPEAKDADGGGNAGPTVVELLAATALAERQAVAAARGDSIAPRTIEKPLPPQVMHDLAGARYQTRRLVEEAESGAAESVVAGIEAREAEAARRIRERPRSDPPPVIPVIQP